MMWPAELDVEGRRQGDEALQEDGEFMKEVMQEALNTPRGELRAFIKEIADSTSSMDPGCTQPARHKDYERRLVALFNAQEEFKREVRDHRRHISASIDQLNREVTSHKGKLGAFVEAKDELRKEIAEHKRHLSASAQVQEDIYKEITVLSEHQFDSGSANFVTHDELEFIKAELNDRISDLRSDLLKPLAYDVQELQAKLVKQQDAQRSFATKQYIDKPISDLHEQLSQIKDEHMTHASEGHVDRQTSASHVHVSEIEATCTREQILEMKALVQEMRKQLSKRKIQPNYVTGSDLEDIMQAAVAELRGNEAATKLHVDKRIFELHSYLSQSMGQLVTEQLCEVKSQMQEMLQQLCQLDIQKGIVSRSVTASPSLPEVQGDAEPTSEDISKWMPPFHGHLPEIKDEGTGDQLLEMKAHDVNFVTHSELEASRGYILSALQEHERVVDKKVSELLSHFHSLSGVRSGKIENV